MKFFLKSIIIFILFFISLIVFLPKEGLYNLAEQKLLKYGVIISGEVVKEEAFAINISGAEIYFEEINTAFLKNLNINTYLFYSEVNANDLRVSKSLTNILPSKISSININYSILNPKNIQINANGDFGSFEGKLQVIDRKIIGELNPSNIMKSKYRNILREFKLVEGKYLYEFKF